MEEFNVFSPHSPLSENQKDLLADFLVEGLGVNMAILKMMS